MAIQNQIKRRLGGSLGELQTLIDYSQHPSITEGFFNHIIASGYWSSTSYIKSSLDAWYVDFYIGTSDWHSTYHKRSNRYVRCVQGGQLEPSSLSRNDDIVTDSTTGLQWQDDTAVEGERRTWIEAIDYCENTLVLGGHSDWRLPNINELLSIVDYSKYDPALDTSIFQNYSSAAYWSSTSTLPIATVSSALYVSFYNQGGASLRSYKSSRGWVRCVRDVQANIPANPSIIMYLLD